MGDMKEDFKALDNHLKEQRSKEHVFYVQRAVADLNGLGVCVDKVEDTYIAILLNGNRVLFYPRSGWYSGKGITDGRGWKNLRRIILSNSKPTKDSSDKKETGSHLSICLSCKCIRGFNCPLGKKVVDINKKLREIFKKTKANRCPRMIDIWRNSDAN
jgi:hypothetical protein